MRPDEWRQADAQCEDVCRHRSLSSLVCSVERPRVSGYRLNAVIGLFQLPVIETDIVTYTLDLRLPSKRSVTAGPSDLWNKDALVR
jgi:hypothetical protein